MKKIFRKIYELITGALKRTGNMLIYPFRMHDKKAQPEMKKMPVWKKCLVWTAWAVSLFHGVVITFGLFFSILYNFVDPPCSSFMVYRMIFDDVEIRKNEFIPLKKLPKRMASMLVRVEDGNFYKHYGIDLDAIESARKRNEKAGFNKYGGSTITQQLVKTLLLVPDKFLIRKYAEIIISLEFDLIMRKDRILELYLNNVEWGPGVFGIEAASIHHFNKHAAKLSRDEVARLITILPNPIKYNVKNFSKRKSMSLRYHHLSPVISE